MGRREEETRKAIKEVKKETFVGTKERIIHEIAISLAVIADVMIDKAERTDE